MTGERISIDKFLPDFESDAAAVAQRELEQSVAAWEAISGEE